MNDVARSIFRVLAVSEQRLLAASKVAIRRVLNLKFPADGLRSMHQVQWMVEPDFRSTKCTLGLEYLRGERPESLEQVI